jgi:hypothetical protein
LAVARANRCDYGVVLAQSDLRRAETGEANQLEFDGAPAGLGALHEAVLVFARKLTLAADTVTDGEVASLVERYGEKQVVAMVLLVAYANFQDRLVLALGLGPEAEDELEPQDVAFATALPGTRRAVPRRPAPPGAADDAAREEDSEWLGLGYQDLQVEMDRQRARRPRIPLPRSEDGGALWGLVGRNYQPELAAGWSACASAFDAEAEPDPVFGQSLFWVITRSLRCFY